MIPCGATMSTDFAIYIYIFVCNILGIMLIGYEAKNLERSYLIEHCLETYI